MNKTLLFAILMIIVLSTPIYSVVIGISPSEKHICVGPDETNKISFFPSTDSEVPYGVEILIDQRDIVITGPKTLFLQPKKTTEYEIIVITKEIGYYNSSIYFCGTAEQGIYDVKQCVRGYLFVNVTEDCVSVTPLNLQISSLIAQNKTTIQLILVFLIILVVFYWYSKH
jgi:hypothetical protein